MIDTFYTINEVAKILKLHPSSVYERAGEIGFFKIASAGKRSKNGGLRITESRFNAYVSSKMDDSAPLGNNCVSLRLLSSVRTKEISWQSSKHHQASIGSMSTSQALGALADLLKPQARSMQKS